MTAHGGLEIYFDLEFSSLSRDGELISLGAVEAITGLEFYGEVTPLPTNCTPFVEQEVLPQLTGQGEPLEMLLSRFAKWLSSFDRRPIELLSDSRWDIFILRKAVTGDRSFAPGKLTLGHDLAVTLLDLPALGCDARERYGDAASLELAKDPRPHHALVDARCLRAGMPAISR